MYHKRTQYTVVREEGGGNVASRNDCWQVLKPLPSALYLRQVAQRCSHFRVPEQ